MVLANFRRNSLETVSTVASFHGYARWAWILVRAVRGIAKSQFRVDPQIHQRNLAGDQLSAHVWCIVSILWSFAGLRLWIFFSAMINKA